MRVLLTGATGFVGKALSVALSSRGHEVVAVSRDAERARHSVPGVSDAVAWDTRSPLPAESLAGIDSVVHLAGEPVAGRWTRAKRERIMSSRRDSTRLVVDAIGAQDSSVRPHLVCASAIGFYGDRGDEYLDESSAAGSGDDFLVQVCLAWEAEAAKVRDAGVKLAIARLGIVLGRGGGALQEMLTPFRLGVGGPVGSGRQWWSWVHIADVVSALVAMVEAGGRDENSWEGPHNVTAPNPVTQRDFARSLGRALKRPAFLPAPAFAIRLALGGFAQELLSSKRVLPKRALANGFEFAFPELEEALANLLG